MAYDRQMSAQAYGETLKMRDMKMRKENSTFKFERFEPLCKTDLNT